MAQSKGPIFTVDWEDWQDALPEELDETALIEEPTLFILQLLDKYEVKAIFYVLGKTKDRHPLLFKRIEALGHVIKSHGQEHLITETWADRRPYAWLGPTGGFYFRILPLWLLKIFVRLYGHFYLHPHDIMLEHPKLINPWFNWKRHIKLKGSRVKLDRLMEEVQFGDPY